MTRHTDARQQLQVGTLRQNQLSHTYGVGAMADLPNLSVITLGLDFWKLDGAKPVPEQRLLAAVRAKLGPQIKDLYLPPYKPEKNGSTDEGADVGVPVSLFPSFLRCTACGLLGRPTAGNFQLKPDSYNPARTRYVHLCEKDKKTQLAVPARFVLACGNGHLDDFPWQYFVHGGREPEGKHALTLHERGTTGEAADVRVSCTDDGCTARSMADAFGDAAAENLPACRGRHPHLKTFEPCDSPVRTLVLGATNSWFPLRLSSITLPRDDNSLDKLVDEYFEQLKLLLHLEDEEKAKLVLPGLSCWPQLEHYGVDAVWEALRPRQEEPNATTDSSTKPTDLQVPEWEKLTADAAINDPDFTTRPEPVPPVAEPWLRRVVLVPRLRQVTALYGFTRIDAPEWEVQHTPNERSAPLSTGDPTWVPCAEMRGEGVFLQFDEDRIAEWENRAKTLHRVKQRLIPGYRKWCAQRGLSSDDWPGMRYVLLHTFSHALIRQLALESGYSASGITERIYANPANPENPENPAMAGILLYTAAPDSEGTLGGLVSLGETNRLGNFIERALEAAKLCSSDPLCSEHDPRTHGRLYGSACHACLFASETSCERGNHYLDRALLVDTIGVTGTGLLSD